MGTAQLLLNRLSSLAPESSEKTDYRSTLCDRQPKAQLWAVPLDGIVGHFLEIFGVWVLSRRIATRRDDEGVLYILLWWVNFLQCDFMPPLVAIIKQIFKSPLQIQRQAVNARDVGPVVGFRIRTTVTTVSYTHLTLPTSDLV